MSGVTGFMPTIASKLSASRPDIDPLLSGRFGDIFTRNGTHVLLLSRNLRKDLWTGLCLASPRLEVGTVRTDWVSDGWTFVKTIWVPRR